MAERYLDWVDVYCELKEAESNGEIISVGMNSTYRTMILKS